MGTVSGGGRADRGDRPGACRRHSLRRQAPGRSPRSARPPPETVPICWSISPPPLSSAARREARRNAHTYSLAAVAGLSQFLPWESGPPGSRPPPRGRAGSHEGVSPYPFLSPAAIPRLLRPWRAGAPPRLDEILTGPRPAMRLIAPPVVPSRPPRAAADANAEAGA